MSDELLQLGVGSDNNCEMIRKSTYWLAALGTASVAGAMMMSFGCPLPPPCDVSCPAFLTKDANQYRIEQKCASRLEDEGLCGPNCMFVGSCASGRHCSESAFPYTHACLCPAVGAPPTLPPDPENWVVREQCATGSPTGTPTGGLGHVSSEACVQTGSVWPSRNIPVCWESTAMTPEFGDFRNRVRAAVRETWEAHSEVTFYGWEACPSPLTPVFTGIRVGHVDPPNGDSPRVLQLGRWLAGVPFGMQLNFTYKNWQTNCAGAGALDCTEKIAVHEFGHALGFGHEQNRSDTQPKWCSPTEGPQGGSCDMYGPWDLDSVMNYCSPAWNGDGNLSPGDIAALQRFYGRAVADPGIRYASPFPHLHLAWSFHGQVPGWNCIAVNEPNDAAGGWDDNFLCTKEPNPFMWNPSGDTSLFHCDNLFESAEPAENGWNDNHLCYIPGSFRTRWSTDGPVEGWSCLQIYEPEDSRHTWTDNYLCFFDFADEAVGLFSAEYLRHGGIAGHRSDEFFGHMCPAGFRREKCHVRKEIDSSDVNCGDLSTGSGEWVSSSPESCECKIHLGADAFEILHCRAQVTGQCRSGFLRCGDECHCGSCGKTCSIDQDCISGACKAKACPSGQRSCGGTCVNLKSDQKNCGACGNFCNAKLEFCSSGKCKLKDPPVDEP